MKIKVKRILYLIIFSLVATSFASIVFAAVQSNALVSGNITVTNNAGTPDTINVVGLALDDVIKAYASIDSVKPIGSAGASNKAQATISVKQLGVSSGSVFVSVTNKGNLESDRVEVTYDAEPKSDMLTSGVITVINFAGLPDTIQVTGLISGDIIKAYDSADSVKPLGLATAAAKATAATISVKQLGVSEGSVFISVTNKNKSESDRIEVAYDAEQQSIALTSDNVFVTNNAGAPDTIRVTGLVAGDVIKAYDSPDKGKLYGSATNATSKTSEATITVNQLGVSSSAGSVYVTITNKGELESDRTEFDYAAELQSTALPSGNIIVTNNAGISDTIEVVSLVYGDTIKAYDSSEKGKLLGSAAVAKAKTYAFINVKQLGVLAGSVYVTVTKTDDLESDRTMADYQAEPKSDALTVSQITVTNNIKIADTIKVTGLNVGDLIKVYDSSINGKLLGSAVDAKSKAEVTVSVKQLGVLAGSVYLTITSKGTSESDRTEAGYLAELGN